MKTEIAGDFRAPAAARRFVTSAFHVAGSTAPPEPDDLVLVVSELVTNAVRAGATVIGVELEVAAHRVELRVTDDASGWPTPRHAHWDDPAGRGLEIVDDLADEWHATDLARGKRVTVAWSRMEAANGGG